MQILISLLIDWLLYEIRWGNHLRVPDCRVTTTSSSRIRCYVLCLPPSQGCWPNGLRRQVRFAVRVVVDVSVASIAPTGTLGPVFPLLDAMLVEICMGTGPCTGRFRMWSWRGTSSREMATVSFRPIPMTLEVRVKLLFDEGRSDANEKSCTRCLITAVVRVFDRTVKKPTKSAICRLNAIW